jgi:hypothetical protein
MTRGRWITGGLIGVAALVVGGEALVSYVSGRLVVGIVSVLVLVGVLAVGFVSLARARRYIAGELAALRAEPPGGALFSARRQRMLELRRRNVAPDLDVLADATAAEEAERGYTGKYLVATTVLIGLVGTFGGLMETLARVAPLLKGDLAIGGPAGALALIAGPLAGLHITFGTSVVAILVTLSLALVQGDVTLFHERLLAELHERTRHVLVPELWPAEESAAERTLRALVELRTAIPETLAKSAEATGARVAAAVRDEVGRLVADAGAELRAAATRSHEAMTAAAATAREAMTFAASAGREAMTTAATAGREAMTTAATAGQKSMTVAATAGQESMTAAATAGQEMLAAAAKDTRAAIESAGASSREALEAAAGSTREAATATWREAAEVLTRATTAVEGVAAALAEVAERTSGAFTSSTTAAVSALADVSGGMKADLEDAARALTTAATEVHAAADALAPTLTELGPQLGALASEVALLAAREDSPEQANAVLDELVRLGEDVERLVATTQSAPAAAEQADS